MDDPKTRLDKLPQAVTDALDDLIKLELATLNPGRFTRVAAVAELAQQLAALYHIHVEDIDEDGVPNEMRAHQALRIYQGPNIFARPAIAPNVRTAMARRGHDMQEEPQRPEDVVRDALSTALPLMRSMNLNNLLALRPQAEALGFDPARLTAEIHEATANLRAPTVAPTALLTEHTNGGLDGAQAAAARAEAAELGL